MIEMHAHILPGFDHGPNTMKESLEMARQAAAAGVPHADGAVRGRRGQPRRRPEVGEVSHRRGRGRVRPAGHGAPHEVPRREPAPGGAGDQRGQGLLGGAAAERAHGCDCAEVAREIGLGDVLKLGRSEMLSGGRRKQSLVGDAIEAVIAAVYKDAGFDAARDMILRLWGDRISQVEADARDAKTSLQEWAQARGQVPPAYLEVAREGPDHAPVFTIAARLADGTEARASAGSKRQAEQAAAAALLQRVEKD